MKNFQIIKESAVKFWKNPVLGVPVIFELITNYILLAIFLVAVIAISGISVSELLTSADALTNTLLSDRLAFLIIIGVVLVAAISAINSFFDGMLIGMINSNKIKLDFEPGKKFFSRIFGFSIFYGLCMLVLIAAIVGLSVLLMGISVWLLAISIILFIALVIAIPLFSLSTIYIVANNLGIKDSMKKSVRFVWKNYFKLLGLMIMVLIVSLACYAVLLLIPVAGTIIYSILAMVYGRICTWMFAVK